MNDHLSKKIDIAIAGGSIAGLCAGNALLTAGYDVHIFERAKVRLTSRGAGIVVQPDLLRLLSLTSAPPLPVTRCTMRQTVSGSGGVPRRMHMPQQFTSWEAIYSTLSVTYPQSRIHYGAEAEVDTVSNDGVTLRVDDKSVHADVFVAADGFRSKSREQFAPDTLSRYAGYVAWRGVVDEADLPADLVDFFDDNFSFCETDGGGHALCYLIPGDGGTTEPGARRLNWVWYVDVPEGAAYDSIMKDNDGRRRDASVPPGRVSPAALSELHRHTAILEKHFAGVVQATAEPFIQSVLDVAPPAMVYGRICLLGDAAFVVRPHTAAAAAKAAADAMALAEALTTFAPDIDSALDAWNRRQVDEGRRLMDYGVMLGENNAGRRTAHGLKTSKEH